MYTSSFSQQIGIPGAEPLPEMKLPAERLARIATRRAFVELKQRFMQAAADISGDQGQALRERVRRAQEPFDLWILRGDLAAELAGSVHDSHSPSLDMLLPHRGTVAQPSALRG